MSNWSYVQNGQQRGPLDTAALHTLLTDGTLPADTLVWRDGMAAWAPARTLPEFAPPGAPPPIADAAAPPVGIPPVTTAPESDAADIEANKIFALLAYIGLLFLVPLLAAPKSKFARYHTNQGIILFLAVLITLAGSVLAMFIPGIMCFAFILPFIAVPAWFFYIILGIINAASGQYKPLPLIGHFKLLS